MRVRFAIIIIVISVIIPIGALTQEEVVVPTDPAQPTIPVEPSEETVATSSTPSELTTDTTITQSSTEVPSTSAIPSTPATLEPEVAASEKNTLAFIPLENVKKDPDYDYLSKNVVESVYTTLESSKKFNLVTVDQSDTAARAVGLTNQNITEEDIIVGFYAKAGANIVLFGSYDVNHDKDLLVIKLSVLSIAMEKVVAKSTVETNLTRGVYEAVDEISLRFKEAILQKYDPRSGELVQQESALQSSLEKRKSEYLERQKEKLKPVETVTPKPKGIGNMVNPMVGLEVGFMMPLATKYHGSDQINTGDILKSSGFIYVGAAFHMGLPFHKRLLVGASAGFSRMQNKEVVNTATDKNWTMIYLPLQAKLGYAIPVHSRFWIIPMVDFGYLFVPITITETIDGKDKETKNVGITPMLSPSLSFGIELTQRMCLELKYEFSWVIESQFFIYTGTPMASFHIVF